MNKKKLCEENEYNKIISTILKNCLEKGEYVIIDDIVETAEQKKLQEYLEKWLKKKILLKMLLNP